MAEKRAHWHEQLAGDAPARLVYVDESGANTKMTRWRGRAPGDRRGKFPFRGFHRQFGAANFANLNCRNAHEFGVSCIFIQRL